MLVIYLVPNGNNEYQFKYMHKKATAWATSIKVGGFQQNEAWKALNSTIPQTMKYPIICHDNKRERMLTHHATYHKIRTHQGLHK